MFSPLNPGHLDEFASRFKPVAKKVFTIFQKRLRRCRGDESKHAELVCHFIYARALAEFLVDIVVTDANEEFLREATDAMKTEMANTDAMKTERN